MLDAPGGPEYIRDEGEPGAPRLLLVEAGGRVVALPTAPLVEVLTSRPYGRIPGAETAIAGVVNRRGRILTVVDLGVALGGGAAKAVPDHRILVLEHGDREVGMAVKDVLQFSGEETEAQVIDLAALLSPLFGEAGSEEGGGDGHGADGGGGEPSLERQ